MKKLTALVIAAAMVLSLVSIPVLANSVFTDNGQPAYDAQKAASNKASLILTVGNIYPHAGRGVVFLFDNTCEVYDEATMGNEVYFYQPGGDKTLKELYEQFNVTVPSNLHGDRETDGYIVNETVYLDIEAGAYDVYMVLPPDPPQEDYWTTSDIGFVGNGKLDDKTFEAGKTYHITVGYRSDTDKYIVCKEISESEGNTTPPPTPSPTPVPTPTAPVTDWATIIVDVQDENVWDGNYGYIMLLDQDHNTYGGKQGDNSDFILKEGAYNLWNRGNIPDSIMDEFEYKIPDNANGKLNSDFVLKTGSKVGIKIPAGKYDYAFIMPDPHQGTTYLLQNYGTAKGFANDFEFEANTTYNFTLFADRQHDAVSVRLQTVEGNQEVPTTTPPPTPTPEPQGDFCWDFEDIDPFKNGWTKDDRDGDYVNWYWLKSGKLGSNGEYTVPNYGEGTGVMLSDAQDWMHAGNYPLNPNNWLISPEFTAGKGIIAHAASVDPDYPEELSIYIYVDNEWKIVYDDTLANKQGEFEEIVINTEQYKDQRIKVAFCHHDSLHGFILELDYVQVIRNGNLPNVPETNEPIVPDLPIAPGATGDLDGDGHVTVTDATVILRSSMGLVNNLTDEQKKACDMDGDGSITLIDATIILRVAMGLIKL